MESLPRATDRRVPLLNVPNLLSAFRLTGAVVLVGVALAGIHGAFVWLLAALLVSDWIDGKLAIAWKQQTAFGARLDSVADASMYAAMMFGLVWLHGDVFLKEWMWLTAVVVSYAVTSLAGLIKYGRIPSYHTRLAKTSWFLVSVSVLVLFAGGPIWPLQATAAVVVITNLEATFMTIILPRWQADIPSLWHAARVRQQQLGPALATPHNAPLDPQKE